MTTRRADQPEVRVSPDGSRVAVRWPLASTNSWHIVDKTDTANAQEPLDVVDTWQQLVFDPEAEAKDYLRRQWATASAKLNTAETKLRHEQQLHGFAQDRIRGLEADIETRWHTANIDESVKTELRHRTAEADTYKSAVQTCSRRRSSTSSSASLGWACVWGSIPTTWTVRWRTRPTRFGGCAPNWRSCAAGEVILSDRQRRGSPPGQSAATLPARSGDDHPARSEGQPAAGSRLGTRRAGTPVHRWCRQ